MARKAISAKKAKTAKSETAVKKTKISKIARNTVLSEPKRKVRAVADKQTRAEILRFLAEETGLSAKQVRAVFLLTAELAKRHVMKRGSGEFSIPEMALKITRKTRPATKKRMGRNPKTGEAVVIPARPARQVVRVRVLKGLKEALV